MVVCVGVGVGAGGEDGGAGVVGRGVGLADAGLLGCGTGAEVARGVLVRAGWPGPGFLAPL